MTGRRRRRRKQLLYDLNEKGGYCKLKEETPERGENHFERGCGPVVIQNCIRVYYDGFSNPSSLIAI